MNFSSCIPNAPHKVQQQRQYFDNTTIQPKQPALGRSKTKISFLSSWWILNFCTRMQIMLSCCVIMTRPHRTMSFPLGIRRTSFRMNGTGTKGRSISSSTSCTTTTTTRSLSCLCLHQNKNTNSDSTRADTNINTASSNDNINNPKIQSTDFEESGFTFELGSFDKKGTWMNIDYNKEYHLPTTSSNYYSIFQSDSDARIPAFSPLTPSPVELCLIRDRMVYIKRDDLLRLRKSNVSGNKARKMLALNELPMEEFPDVIVSYGGPQSNAMVALAAIVNARNVELEEGIVEGGTTTTDGGGGGSGMNENEEDEIQNNDFWFQDDSRLDDDDDNDDYENDVDDYESGKDDDDDDDDDDLMNATIQDKNRNEKGTNGKSLKSVQPKLGQRKKRFVYYTKKLPRYLRNQPNGNLLRALSLGMELAELSSDEYKRIFGGDNGGSVVAPEEIDPPVPYKSLWVPQGAACGLAVPGAKLMAEEIFGFWSAKGNGMPLTVCLPGGTCASAILLSREINILVKGRNQKLKTEKDGEDGEEGKEGEEGEDDEAEKELDIIVSVIPCVGDVTYAERQMKALDLCTGGNGIDNIPLIFKPWRNAFPRFGEPSPHVLKTFMEMKNDHGIFLDLLYGAAAWNTLLQYLTSQRDSPIKGRQVMYVHSGGLEGVSSQLTRYRHKGLIDSSHLQS